MVWFREDYALTVLRMSLGIVFIAHAVLKFAVFGMAGTELFFKAVGIWSWLAWPVTIVEFVAGMALLAGFYTIFASVLLIPITLGAIWVHWPNGWVFSVPNGGWEYPAFLLVGLVCLLVGGPGRLALVQDQ